MFGFAVLVGPLNHLKHLISRERLPFSFAYVTSLALTLYFSVGVRKSVMSFVSILTNSAGPLIHRVSSVCHHPNGEPVDICVCLFPWWSYDPAIWVQYCVPRCCIVASKMTFAVLCRIYCSDLIVHKWPAHSQQLKTREPFHTCSIIT